MGKWFDNEWGLKGGGGSWSICLSTNVSENGETRGGLTVAQVSLENSNCLFNFGFEQAWVFKQLRDFSSATLKQHTSNFACMVQDHPLDAGEEAITQLLVLLLGLEVVGTFLQVGDDLFLRGNEGLSFAHLTL